MHAEPPTKNPACGIFRRAAFALLGRTGGFAKFTPSLGQTLAEMEAKCGPSVRTDVLNGTSYVGFECPSINVVAAMDDGKAVMLLYTRDRGLFPAEIRTLLDASAQGSSWANAAGNRLRWLRADGGATALHGGSNNFFIYDLDAGARIAAEIMAAQ